MGLRVIQWVWYSDNMSKKKTKTARKTVTKTAKTAKKMSSRRHYTYNTPISEVAQDYGLDSSAMPDMNLGDYLKDRYPAASRILKMMSG